MSRATNRTPEDPLRIGRIVCVGGEVFAIAVCITLLFLMPWPSNVIVVVITATMLTTYNIVLWRWLKNDANRQSPNDPHEGR